MKKVLYGMVVLACILAGCSEKQPTDSTASVFGLFESAVFIEPGPTDGGVDIQSAGGSLQIAFNPDGTFTSELSIPAGLAASYPQGHTMSSGTFTIRDEKIAFSSGAFILDSIQWDAGSKRLETYDVPPRGRPFKIILFFASK